MKLVFNLPPLEQDFANPPETRPAKLGPWLDKAVKRDATAAARTIGDALAATNRIALSDARRLELANLYWKVVAGMWPALGREFSKAPHPLSGDALDAARVAITLATEIGIAYKRLLAREADKRLSLGGQKLMVALVRRALQASARVLVNSYVAYAPVPPQTWHDMHATYAFARSRNLHQVERGADDSTETADLVYLKSLLLALANPYGFHPGQIELVLRYLDDHAHAAKLTDVPPVHRMAKAVAIVPVGHDFPPFSANKGGAVDGTKLFLLTYDLAFTLQEQVRKLETGSDPPVGFRRDIAQRSRNLALLRRLLRQWAIPPARQFSRLPSRGRVVATAGFLNIWNGSRVYEARLLGGHPDLPAPTTCQILNQTPHGYALRQVAASPASLRINDLIALRPDGRKPMQIAIVRWFRNTMNATALEFGCELVCEGPQAATAAPENATDAAPTPVVVMPGDKTGEKEAVFDQMVIPAGTFGLEHAMGLWMGKSKQIAVLIKLVDQGPDYEIYEYASVG
jgi:hypothetical protein